MAGCGLDLLLFALLLAAVAWLYRQRPGGPAAAGTASPRRTAAPVWQRLRGYYPRVARQAGYDPASLRPF
jgi:hypothetical protein